MTVRVRSLIRTTTAAARPPVPPVTMRFLQQPTNTVVGELFEPPIVVQVSDRGSDVLLITIDSGDCHIDGQYATSDANGIATFEGLTAGSNPSVGCILRVDNLTRPEVPSIRSVPFNTLPPVIVSGWELVSRGSVGAFTTSLRTEELTLESAGATDAFAVTSTFNYVSYYIFDSRGNVWTLISSITALGGLLLLWRATSNPDNPPFYGPILGTTGTLVFYSQFPNMAVYNFKRQTSGTGVIAGSPYFNSLQNVNTIGPIAPMNIPFTNSLVITGYADNDWTTPVITEPTGYVGREYVGIGAYANGNLVGAYKILDNPSVENPVWLTSGYGSPAMIMGAFEA